MKYFDEDNEEVRDCVHCRFSVLMFWQSPSSVFNFDLIYLIFQICINSQGEDNI